MGSFNPTARPRWLTAAIPATVMALLLVAAALLGNLLLGASWRVTLTLYFVNLIAVVGLGLFSGNSGILSFGHPAFIAVGAYAGALLTMDPETKASFLSLPGWLERAHLGLVPGIAGAALVAAAVGAATGIVIARASSGTAAIATFALLIVVNVVLAGAVNYTRGNQTLFDVPQLTTPVIAGVIAAIVVAVARIYRDTWSGLRLRASREDDVAARSLGIRVDAERWRALILSAAICGLSGALTGWLLTAFTPNTFYLELNFLILAMMIVGGWTTVSGAIYGTTLVTAISEIARWAERGPGPLPTFVGLRQAAIGIVILLTLYLRPQGISGLVEADELVRRYLRRRSLKGQRKVLEPIGGVESDGKEGESITLRSHTPEFDPVGRAGLLEARGLVKRFGGVLAVDDVSLSVRGGEIVGLIGPNGSGKTTLVNMLSGVLRPSAGSLFIDGLDVTGYGVTEIARRGVARTFQNVRLFGQLSVRENIEVAMGIPRKTRAVALGARNTFGDADEIIRLLRLTEYAASPANSLAYGVQRPVEIGRALATSPSYLLLDEPAAGMNEAETDELRSTLAGIAARSGLGLLIIEHDLPLISGLCDRVVVLNEGRVISDGVPEVVLRDPAVVRAYVGDEIPE